MIKTVIFDFDGTLCDSFGEMMDCFKSVVKKRGLLFDNSNVELLRSTGAKYFFESFCADKQISASILNEVRESIKLKTLQIKLFEDISKINELVSLGINISILSSSKQEYIKEILTNNKLNSGIFKEIISEDNIYGKGEILKKQAQKQSLSLDEIIYVGDEVRDIEAAKQAGTQSAAVTWGYNDKNLMLTTNPTVVVSSFQELINFVKKQNLLD